MVGRPDESIETKTPAQGATIACPGTVLVMKVQGRSVMDSKPQVPELTVLWLTFAPIVTSAELAGARATAIARQMPAVSPTSRNPLPRPELISITRSLRLKRVEDQVGAGDLERRRRLVDPLHDALLVNEDK